MNLYSFQPVVAAVAAWVVCLSPQTSAANLSLYEGDGMFLTGAPAGFAFGGFSGNVTETISSLTIDASSFGGIGRDLTQTDFDASEYQLRIVYRLLPGNEAEDFRVVLRDNDGDDSAPGQGTEDHQIFIDTSFATPLNDGSGFSEQFSPLNSVFTDKSFGFTNGGDGALNPGLDQWQLQSAFGGTDRLHLEVRSVELVPEPGSAALLGAGLTAFVLRRRP
ncbi:MAG: PEP-CTERM sorting domain-containing protein [Planctomycetota bacterium]